MPDLAYTALEKLTVQRPTDRITYLAKVAKDKYILDLGALDETAIEAKRGTKSWLHLELANTAKFVRGIDSSCQLKEKELKTSDNSIIHYGDIFNIENVLSEHGIPDIIIGGEIIEHLDSPLTFLQKMKSIPQLKGKKLILTTPNACCIHNFIIGLTRRESTHIDHLTILSYKTINTLCKRSGFSNWNIRPYYMRFPEMINKAQGATKACTIAFQKAVNCCEYIFPLLSGGWIIEIDI